jgi:hypothetical protein
MEQGSASDCYAVEITFFLDGSCQERPREDERGRGMIFGNTTM